jgi:anti-sigma B factor antagonist
MPDSAIATIEQHPDLVVIHVLAHELDQEQLDELLEDVHASADADPHRTCILDLAQVSFMPSLALAAMVRVYGEFQARAQRLMLSGLQPQVRHVFVMTRLDRLFELHDDVASATAAARQ